VTTLDRVATAFITWDDAHRHMLDALAMHLRDRS